MNELAGALEYLADLGVDRLYSPSASKLARTERAKSVSTDPGPAKRTSRSTLPTTQASLDSPAAVSFSDLAEGARVLHDCTCCRLSERRTQIVFGVGDPNARIMFIGEGPGRDEDLQGEPFVGRAGQLLTDIIQKGIGIKRSDVYIANVVKCRPPENRNPEPDEVESCRPFLVQQVRLVAPEVIITLGKFAAHAILGVTTPITRLRGQWGEYEGIPVMPTFHPAYLLRNPAGKKQVWEDIKTVMERLGLTMPER